MTTRCSQCKCEKLNNLFSIRENTGRQYKTCIKCRSKSFQCTQCDSKFGRNSTLTQHIKNVHDKLKPYECARCDYKCSQKGHLNTHVETVHDKLRPHECKLCNAKFGQKAVLNTHIKICTGVRRGTAGECAVMDILDKMSVTYIHDSTFEVKDTKLLRWDFQVFFEQKLIGFIEYDGRQHFTPRRFGGMSLEKAQQALLDTRRRDVIKNEYCQKNNYLLLRIPYTEFADISDIVCDWIVENTNWGFE